MSCRHSSGCRCSFIRRTTTLEAASITCSSNTPPNGAPWPAVLGTSATAGTGSDLVIQTMAAGPYGLLLSNVNVGYGSRPWGQVGTVQSASSFMTVWNMNSSVKVCRTARRGWWLAGRGRSAISRAVHVQLGSS
jgi:hypothetical protein